LNVTGSEREREVMFVRPLSIH